MRVTVAICTCNRERDLPETLESVRFQNYPAGDYEILIVDNNSSDRTADIAREYAAATPNARYAMEPEPGLSHARNRAIAEARGELLLFLDDDAVARPDWISGLAACFEDESVACAGGKIVPDWETASPPDWLPEDYYSYYTILDYADGVTEMNAGAVPYGANMAFRTDVLRKHGGFRTDLGRVGGKLLSGEESELIRRLKRTHKVLYTPHAVVRHKIAAERINRKWFLRRLYWQGVTDLVHSADKRRFVFRSQVKFGMYLAAIPVVWGGPKRRMAHLAKLAYRLGVVRHGFRRLQEER
ncbi:glycosyltransferase [Paenibacillus thermoaerophilus]|uniref:Glycosyltransferase n=1 Tax=Paenibacillus thermoaerophilus TaxID=1215385 RepID=A0ABW2V5V5_9BACL|nr:glycosyltransferase [Paenibacillus thermoaerophilus]